MKCSNCGTTYKKDDHYCENCGSKINKPQKENNILKTIKKNKTKIISITILFVLVVAIFQIISYLRSSEYIASNYLKAVVNNDVTEIFNIIDLETNDFYNKNILKEKNTFAGATNIELIKKIENEDEALLTYRYQLNGNSYITNVSLSKSNNLFSTWNVNSGRISKNVTIKVPKDASIKIDDIDLKNYLDESSSTEDYDVYTIDHMVTGEYKVEVTLKDGTVVSDNIDVSNNQSYSVGNVELSEENETTLITMSQDFMNQLYISLINDVTSSNLNYNDEIKDIYKDLRYNYKKSNVILNSIEYTDLEIVEAEYNEDAKLEITFETEYNYSVSYTSNNTESTYSGTNRGTVILVFDYDESYTISDMKLLKNNFPIRK